MAEKICIVRELNIVDDTDLVSPTTIWACIGDSGDYRGTGTKVAGPIPLLFADRMIDGLRKLLQQLGHEVVIETAADD